ncbi:unnamed protein product, partial [Mesorhabditis belari]|uniref:Transmembrane protein n=1 Tax=Mesorhabditis belari TaxID=2138241 RepID=A0AAF3E997_9BILA
MLSSTIFPTQNFYKSLQSLVFLFVYFQILFAYPYTEDPTETFNEQTCSPQCHEQVSDFLSYHECCGDSCCHRYRFWVIPGMIAAMGFFGGAFFALCFQCR